MLALGDILKAQKNIEGIVKKTPVVKFTKDIYLKLENQQPVVNGFKIRGAANYLVSKGKRFNEVITSALGTHGFAVGYVGKKLGIKTICVMPTNSPKEAVKKMKRLVDEVLFMEDPFAKTEQAAQKYARQKKVPFIHPYNDSAVIAGQGTIGLEILEQIPKVKNVYVPVSGGGLISGIGIAIKLINPRIRIIGVQPSVTHAMQTAIAKGKITTVDFKKSLAEKLTINLNPETITFSYVKKYVDDFILVDEKEIAEAIRLIYKKTKQKAEGSGVAALAAALKDNRRNGLSVCILSGGNISKENFAKVINKVG